MTIQQKLTPLVLLFGGWEVDRDVFEINRNCNDLLLLYDLFTGSGTISFDEFKECMYEKMSQQTVDEDLMGAFQIFDEDGDGYISPDEIQLLFKKLGELISTDEAVEIMKDCDANQDGLIDFDGMSCS